MTLISKKKDIGIHHDLEEHYRKAPNSNQEIKPKYEFAIGDGEPNAATMPTQTNFGCAWNRRQGFLIWEVKLS